MSIEIAQSEADEAALKLNDALDYLRGVQSELEDSVGDFEVTDEEVGSDISALDDFLWEFRDLESDLEDFITRLSEARDEIEKFIA